MQDRAYLGRELDVGFTRAVDLDDERDRRLGLGDYAPSDLTVCRTCATRHDFESCPACAGVDA